jgi:hypothetical protein
LRCAKYRPEGDILAVRKALGAGGRAAPGFQARGSASVEIERPLPRRPAGAVGRGGISRRSPPPLDLFQVSQNLPDDLQVVDTGDDPHLPPAALALLELDAKHALQSLRPPHGTMPLGRAALGGAGRLSPPRRRDLGAQRAVRRQDTVVPV